jgi:hypothetical protein
VIEVQDDGWLPVLTITDLSRLLQCAQEDHNFRVVVGV